MQTFSATVEYSPTGRLLLRERLVNPHLSASDLPQSGENVLVTVRREGEEAVEDDRERVCVTILATDSRNRVCLIRSAKPGRSWELPGGKKRRGEPWREAALRELLEETGLRARLADGPPYDVLDGVAVQGAGYPSTILVVRAFAEGEPTPGSDAAEARWVDVRDIPWSDLSKIGSAETVRRWARETKVVF